MYRNIQSLGYNVVKVRIRARVRAQFRASVRTRTTARVRTQFRGRVRARARDYKLMDVATHVFRTRSSPHDPEIVVTDDSEAHTYRLRPQVGVCGGVAATLRAMATFPQDAEIQGQACTTVTNLSHNCDRNRIHVVEHGGVILILNAMQVSGEDWDKGHDAPAGSSTMKPHIPTMACEWSLQKQISHRRPVL